MAVAYAGVEFYCGASKVPVKVVDELFCFFCGYVAC